MSVIFEFESEQNSEEELEAMLPGCDEELAGLLCDAVLDSEGCPYECVVNILITDAETVHRMNREFRGIDRTTDVLSFPALDYENPSDFSAVDEELDYLFDPESGELILGDMALNVSRVLSQAEEYGHSIKREFSFLIVHSLFHLLGYDHMTPEEAAVMEEKQEAILKSLGILR